MSKPRVAIFDFACCEGCQLQIVNMEEEILDLLSVITPVEWREAISDQSDEYDIAIIEGSITRPEDEERVKTIRQRAGIVIALGSCATHGGVNKMKNTFDLGEVKQYVYKDDADQPHLDTAPTKALHEVIKVDYNVYGCPIDASELAHVVKSLLAGKEPKAPDYPVCVECKMRENCCRYEYNEICLGPVTRAGCDARCPSNGLWCFGCRGLVDDPNTEAAAQVMDKYGKTFDDLKGKMALFLTDEEVTRA
jgi:coenzyme F420-reducing hydrogenase gamma subunit